MSRLRDECESQVKHYVDDPDVIAFLTDELVAGYLRLNDRDPSDHKNGAQRFVEILTRRLASSGIGRWSALEIMIAPRRHSEFQSWEEELDRQIKNINEQLGPRWRLVYSDKDGYKLAFRVSRGTWETLPCRSLSEIVLGLKRENDR